MCNVGKMESLRDCKLNSPSSLSANCDNQITGHIAELCCVTLAALKWLSRALIDSHVPSGARGEFSLTFAGTRTRH